MEKTPPHLLLVDDERTDLAMLEQSFAGLSPGLRVDLCHGSTDAVARIVDGGADIVLLDINMPGLSGFDVLRQTREKRPGNFPAVIMLSNSDNPSDIRRSYAEGASAYVVKPSNVAGYKALANSVGAFWAGVVARP